MALTSACLSPIFFVASFVDRRPEAANAGSFVVVSMKFATKLATKFRREEVLSCHSGQAAGIRGQETGDRDQPTAIRSHGHTVSHLTPQTPASRHALQTSPTEQRQGLVTKFHTITPVSEP